MPQLYAKSFLSSSQVQAACDESGALVSRSERLQLAESGKYFKACNGTMGTGIAMGVQTSFSDTANVLFLMRNGSATKRVIIDYIRLICAAAGVAATSSRLALVLDSANRYSSGGTDLTTNIMNAKSSETATSAVDVLRYSCTASAAVAKRQVANMVLKTQALPCWTVGDEVVLAFAGPPSQGLLSGAGAVQIVKNVGPVVLSGQNHCMLVHMWNPASTTAPSWEFELGWWEL